MRPGNAQRIAEGKTVTTLVLGGRAGEREAAIAAALTPGLAVAIILEGLPDGVSVLGGPDWAASFSDPADLPQVLRIAPACLCCAGNLVLRVTLNRLLRRPPARLFISVANSMHLEQLRLWLSSPPYDAWLALGPDLGVL